MEGSARGCVTAPPVDQSDFLHQQLSLAGLLTQSKFSFWLNQALLQKWTLCDVTKWHRCLFKARDSLSHLTRAGSQFRNCILRSARPLIFKGPSKDPPPRPLSPLQLCLLLLLFSFRKSIWSKGNIESRSWETFCSLPVLNVEPGVTSCFLLPASQKQQLSSWFKLPDTLPTFLSTFLGSFFIFMFIRFCFVHSGAETEYKESLFVYLKN